MKIGRLICIITLLLLIALILFFTIRGLHSPITLSPEKAIALYTNATASLDLYPKSYKIDHQKIIGGEGNPVTELRQQIIQCNDLGTEAFTATVEEVLSIGTQKISSTETFRDNTLYCTLEESAFAGEMTQETFLSRYAPFILLDPQLYPTVDAQKYKGIYTLSFKDGLAPENWVNLSGNFQHSEGTVIIDDNGYIQGYTYTCEYSVNSTAVRLTVSTKPSPEERDYTFASGNINYKRISDPTAPKSLEIACAHLLEIAQVEATYRDEIYCQAFDDRRNQMITVATDADSAEVNTQIILENRSKVGGLTEILKREIYKDGRYTISVNNAAPTEDPQITSEQMHQYCKNILIGTVLLPEYIESVSVIPAENKIRYTFEGNSNFADLLQSNACEALYQNPDILASQTQSYSTESASFYLELDIATGLPAGSGFLYDGTYSTDGLPYRLLYAADQSYTIN